VNLTDMTPVQIDTVLADLYGKEFDAQLRRDRAADSIH